MRSRLAVEDGEVVVGVRGRPRAKLEHAPAEVHVLGRRDGVRRQHDSTSVGALSERALQRGNVVRSAPAQRIGEPLMTDDLRMIVVERRIAEDVIRMHVRVDDEAHRQGRERADRRAQRAPDDIAAAGVDYSDAARADDEAHIGNVAIVVAGDVGQLAVMNVDARCRILERQARGVGASRARRDGRRECQRRQPSRGHPGPRR